MLLVNPMEGPGRYAATMTVILFIYFHLIDTAVNM